jgi:hypothetical protein
LSHSPCGSPSGCLRYTCAEDSLLLSLISSIEGCEHKEEQGQGRLARRETKCRLEDRILEAPRLHDSQNASTRPMELMMSRD